MSTKPEEIEVVEPVSEEIDSGAGRRVKTLSKALLAFVAWGSLIALLWCLLLGLLPNATWPQIGAACMIFTLIGIVYGPDLK